MRTVLVLAALIAIAGFDLRPAPAADLSLRGARAHRTIVTARPWCVIENTGTAVWSCYPTLAACRPHQLPGTTLYCIHDPIPHRRLVELR